MKQGDFSKLAKAYINRPGYSLRLLNNIANVPMISRSKFKVADIGAGTGKLSENLLKLGFNVDCVEPNIEMLKEGIKYTKNKNAKWTQGSAEDTGLKDKTYDWVLMGSSFHWVDFKKAINEFERILKPNGKFTAIWNPRNLQVSEFHMKIEKKINEIATNIKRKSSGLSGITSRLSELLIKSGVFNDVIFSETQYYLNFSRERYIGAWHSTNDIQAQVGESNWKKIIKMIENETKGMDTIKIPYKSRAWTAYLGD